MTKFIFYLIFSFFCFIEISIAESTFRCTNVEGIDLNYSNNGIKSSKDGYAGTTFVLKIESTTKGSVIWEGGANSGFQEDLVGVNGSKDGWITWVSAWPQVTRMYTLFIQGNQVAFAMTETQSQLFTNNPQVRSFFGTCM